MTSIPDLSRNRFPVRRMDFDFAETKQYWFNNDAGLTHFMTALSALFPVGERFFVDSVRAVRKNPKIADNVDLQAQISAFIGQEAMHSKEHHALNMHASEFGYKDIEWMEAFTATVLSARKILTPFAPIEMIDLAATCALEHFTALLAEQVLNNPKFQSMMAGDPVMLKLWLWHCVEETEHKAVAYDVYKNIYGTDKGSAYVLRIVGILMATTLILGTQSYFTARLLQKDGKLAPKYWLKVANTFYGINGLFIKAIPHFLDYFKPSFHPNDHNTIRLLSDWKRNLSLSEYKPS
ncbi:metal-dependent hydrolase [Aquirhabdus parva]|uniref:Metal-dependent hydrolase n=1 Tax=Aquirhabdus parva TaxID=2283318 RepID=A0A345P555_9GAMM|nr:metal-dependent hydrolase [Aquirhabdus parva]AXI02414.1 metal-dependent hydrolase [Aquirhabdus parva]